MKKKLIFCGIAAAVVVLLLWAWPRCILAALAGWIGRAMYAKRLGR